MITDIDLSKWRSLTASMAQPLTVELGPRTYPIHFLTEDAAALKQSLAELASAGRASVVLTDTGVAAALAGPLADALAGLPRLAVAAGEKSKSLETLGRVWDFLAASGLTRQGMLWVVGGGVTGDLGGFAAASYLRGIDYMQVPTTLLAMVDSSVGGKTGLNLTAGKNLVGAFHHPRAVFIATDFLKTLPPREFAAGMAEVIKYGLLGDGALFARLEKEALDLGSPDLPATIRRCCELKAAIVRADEFERAPEGGRALLNLGHTFGHAIEQVTGYGSYLHGEAVAIGLAGAARLSHKLGLIPVADIARVESVLAAHHLPVRLQAPLAVVDLQSATTRDKKNRAGGLRFVVLSRIGEAATRSGIPAALVESVWRELGAV